MAFTKSGREFFAILLSFGWISGLFGPRYTVDNQSELGCGIPDGADPFFRHCTRASPCRTSRVCNPGRIASTAMVFFAFVPAKDLVK